MLPIDMATNITTVGLTPIDLTGQTTRTTGVITLKITAGSDKFSFKLVGMDDAVGTNKTTLLGALNSFGSTKSLSFTQNDVNTQTGYLSFIVDFMYPFIGIEVTEVSTGFSLSVQYAFSKASAGGGGVSPEDPMQNFRLTALEHTRLKIDGTMAMSGDLNMETHKITNVVDPVDAQDAVTKAFLELKIPNSPAGNLYRYLITDAGGTPVWSLPHRPHVRVADWNLVPMQGLLGDDDSGLNRPSGAIGPLVGVCVCHNRDSDSFDDYTIWVFDNNGRSWVRRKNWGYTIGAWVDVSVAPLKDRLTAVEAKNTEQDAEIAKRLNIDGTVPMTGDLNMGTYKISNVVDPVDPQDAATKAYVDSNVGSGNDDAKDLEQDNRLTAHDTQIEALTPHAVELGHTASLPIAAGTLVKVPLGTFATQYISGTRLTLANDEVTANNTGNTAELRIVIEGLVALNNTSGGAATVLYDVFVDDVAITTNTAVSVANNSSSVFILKVSYSIPAGETKVISIKRTASLTVEGSQISVNFATRGGTRVS